MPSGSMMQAITLAQQICWDEGYGYRLGGHAASHADGVDCGGLVFHCLHHAGFNVNDTSPGTRNMVSILSGIGFNILPYDRNTFQPQPGDIFIMNTTGSGHTFFYMENIPHYSDYSADSDNITNTGACKVEASSSRGHTGQGDSRKNGTGAYWEVWSHAYYNLVDPSTYQDSEVKVARCPWNDIMPIDTTTLFVILLGAKII